MAELANYIFRETFEEPFSLCRPTAAFTGKACLHLQQEINIFHAAWRGWRPPPKAGTLQARGSTLLHTRGQVSGWDLLVDHEMWCSALRRWQDSAVSLCEPTAPCLLHRPGGQAGS